MKKLTITRQRYKRALAKAEQRGHEKGHMLGCVQVYNKSVTIVRNAAAGGLAPTRKLPRRLHNMVVDELMSFGEDIAQRLINQVDRRLKAGKKLKVRFNGRAFRPVPVGRVARGQT